MMIDPKKCPCGKTAPWLARIGFGLVLVGYGVNHYRFFGDFSDMAVGSVGSLGPVAGLLAYIVPALMIVGGVLFAVKLLPTIAKFCVLGSLGGIMGWGGVAVMLGGGTAGPDMMPFIVNAAVLLLAYYAIKKMHCCCGSACASPKPTA